MRDGISTWAETNPCRERPIRYNRRMFERPSVVVVTGSGGSGCGRAIAARFARDNAAVVVSDIDEAGGHATVRLIEQRGGRSAFFRADVGDELQAQRLIEFAVSTFGGISVLVNNASSPLPDREGMAGWRRSLQTDLLGTIYVTQWAVDIMRQSGAGSIVNISSISALWHGRETPGGLPGYDVAKAGVIRLTTVLAKEVAKDGIRVNCLAPGWIGSDRMGQGSIGSRSHQPRARSVGFPRSCCRPRTSPRWSSVWLPTIR